MKEKFIRYFTKIMFNVAELSTCFSKKVGAVLVSEDNRILATGYNGVPSGHFECKELVDILRYIYKKKPLSFNDVIKELEHLYEGVRLCEPLPLYYLGQDKYFSKLPECIQNLVLKYDVYGVINILKRLLNEIRHSEKMFNIDFSNEEMFIRKLNFIHYKYEIHAEQNVISQCVKYGVIASGASLFVTLSPCLDCARLIVASGIKKVFYVDEYIDRNYGESSLPFLKENDVDVIKLDV